MQFLPLNTVYFHNRKTTFSCMIYAQKLLDKNLTPDPLSICATLEAVIETTKPERRFLFYLPTLFYS